MKSYYFILLAITTLVFTSCNKNQSKTNNIDGYWEVTYMEIQGQGGWDYPGTYFDFKSCKLREKGYCDMTVTDFWEGTDGGYYNVTHNGDQVNMTISYNTQNGVYLQPYSFDLKSLSDSKMVLVNLNAEPNTYSRLEMRKQQQ